MNLDKNKHKNIIQAIEEINLDDYIKRAHVCREYDCDKSLIEKHVKKGKFPKGRYLINNRDLYYKRSDVDAWARRWWHIPPLDRRAARKFITGMRFSNYFVLIG